MRLLVATVALVGCASAPAPSATPRGTASAFELDRFLASTSHPTDASCRRARAVASTPVPRARVERRCGDVDAAVAHYREALAIDARCDVALELAELLPEDSQRELLAPFATVEPASLESIEAPVCRAATLRLAALLRGDEDDAPTQLLATLLGRRPDDPDALAELVLHHLARGQTGAASSVCERLPTTHAEGMHACARVALASGALHQAERRLRAAVAADGDGAAVRTLGRLLLATRRYAAAAPLFDRLHRQHPEDYEALIELGVALVWSGCFEQGRAAYHHASRLDPDRPEAWYDIGLLYQFAPTPEQLRESLAAFARFREIAESRPELAPFVRAIRDEECLAERRAPRERRRERASSCDPGHEMHIYWDAEWGLEQMLRQMAAPHAPPTSDETPLRCEDYAPAR